MNTEKSSFSSFDPRKYRDALGCFATGVCLIATKDEEGRARGLIANSFSSVSLDPPMILWSIDQHSDRFDLFMNAETFSVNMLHSDDVELSNMFARTTHAVIPPDRLETGVEGVPRLNHALASIECRTAWRQQAGDHVVIFGSVLDFQSEDGAALGYFKGGYTPIRKD